MLGEYSHLGDEYLIEGKYESRKIDTTNRGKSWRWIQFARVVLPQLRIRGLLKSQISEDRKGARGILRELIKTVLKASLHDHRASRYVENLSGGRQPP